jgi:hypothetical protein
MIIPMKSLNHYLAFFVLVLTKKTPKKGAGPIFSAKERSAV